MAGNRIYERIGIMNLKTLVSVPMVSAMVFSAHEAEAVIWNIDNPSYSSWANGACWPNGVIPDSESNVEFAWENNLPAAPYYVQLDSSPVIARLGQPSWRSVPGPTYIGTEFDRIQGRTLTLHGLYRRDHTGSDLHVDVPVVLSEDCIADMDAGYNAQNGFHLNYTVSGPYGITKKGSGSLWLNGQNTYTGVTTVEAGQLYAGDGAAHTASFVSPVVNNSKFTVDAGLFGTTVLPGLSGTGSFTKKGRGTLAFAGAEIAGGSFLIARHQWQEPNAGNIDCTVPGGTTLNFTSQTWEDHFTFLGTENLDMGTSPVTLKVYQGNNPRVVTVLKNMLTVGGSISGSMGLTKAGKGAMTLTAANAFTGTTSVNGGVLRLAGAGTSGTGAISIGADGALELDNSSVNADRLGDAAAISVGGRLTLKGNAAEETVETVGALTLATGATRISVEPSGEASASLVFASFASHAAGNTTIFDIPANASVGFTTAPAAIPGALVTSGAGYALAGISEEGLVVPLEANGEDNLLYDLTGDISVEAATLSSVEFRNNSGSPVAVTLTGALATANGILFSGDSPITLTGGSIAGNEAKEAIILVANAGGVTLETPVSSDNVTFGGVGDLAIKGNLTAAGSASGYINVNVDGNITWAQKNAKCGATRFFCGRTTFAEGARLYEAGSEGSWDRPYLRVGLGAVVDFNGVSARVNGLAGLGEVTNSSETPCTLTCNWLPAGSNYVNPYNPKFEGNLTENLSLSLTSDGYYRDRYNQSLTGENTFTGNLSVGGGATLSLGNRNALGSSTLYMNGGRLDSQGVAAVACTDGYLKSFTFKGSTSLDLSSGTAHLNAAAVTLTVDANTLTLGALEEETAGSTLTKAGAGTLVLNGEAHYTGATTVSAGTLRLNGAVASRELSVVSGATLAFVSTTELHKKVSLAIEEGGKLNLKNLDPIQVKRLFVAGVELTETGTYGAVGSGARHELACISGWGQLKVGGSGFTVLVK